jgi:hypothetical protein
MMLRFSRLTKNELFQGVLNLPLALPLAPCLRSVCVPLALPPALPLALVAQNGLKSIWKTQAISKTCKGKPPNLGLPVRF